MENSRYINNNDSTLLKEGLSQNTSSGCDISLNISQSDFYKNIETIKKIFREKIKPLRANFSIDEYERYGREIRNIIIGIRKIYYNSYKENIENQNSFGQPTRTIFPSQIRRNEASNNINSNSNNNQNNNNNENSINFTNTNSQTNVNTILNNQNALLNNKINQMNNQMNDTTFSRGENIPDSILKPKSINIIYYTLQEIAFFLMSYDEIFINYENKSAYVTLKLFLQMATLHFIKNIFKHDFIVCLMNKCCNILCQYNQMQKEDESIKKILSLEEKDLKRIMNLIEFDGEIIQKVKNKIDKEIEKIDLIYKMEKVKEDIENNKIFNNGKREVKENPEDEIQLKINKLKDEMNILNDIQKNIGNDYKIFLKESHRNELEQFNVLINKISEYKTPLIRQQFIDIIMRNKEVFKYINENIIAPKIPYNNLKNFELYSINKNLSIYPDKYIITGKIILDVLSLPLNLDLNYYINETKKFANKFLNSLSQNKDEDQLKKEEEEKIKKEEEEEKIKKEKDEKNIDEKGEEENKNDEEGKDEKDLNKKAGKEGLFKHYLNYYHLILFAFTIASKMKDKEYFSRISAKISTSQSLGVISDILDDIDQIENLQFNNESKKQGKSSSAKNDGGETLLFDYVNNNNNTISFLLEKKKKFKEGKKKKSSIPFSNLEICSVLSKKLFNVESIDPIVVVFTIAVKYWAIQRRLFKYDYAIRKNSKDVFDDSTLLYFIYYFFMHKGLKNDIIDFGEEIKKDEKNEEEEKKIEEEKEKIEEEKKKIKEEKKKIEEEKVKTEEEKKKIEEENEKIKEKKENKEKNEEKKENKENNEENKGDKEKNEVNIENKENNEENKEKNKENKEKNNKKKSKIEIEKEKIEEEKKKIEKEKIKIKEEKIKIEEEKIKIEERKIKCEEEKIKFENNKENKEKNGRKKENKEKNEEEKKKFEEKKKKFEEKKKKFEKEEKEENENADKKLSYINSIFLKKLGELFIEFFWFMHEIVKLAENLEKEKKTVRIDLSNKIYSTCDLLHEEKEFYPDRPPIKIPVLLQLNFKNERIFSQICKGEAKALKRECIRALYFILNKEGKEIFTFLKGI